MPDTYTVGVFQQACVCNTAGITQKTGKKCKMVVLRTKQQPWNWCPTAWHKWHESCSVFQTCFPYTSAGPACVNTDFLQSLPKDRVNQSRHKVPTNRFLLPRIWHLRFLSSRLSLFSELNIICCEAQVWRQLPGTNTLALLLLPEGVTGSSPWWCHVTWLCSCLNACQLLRCPLSFAGLIRLVRDRINMEDVCSH